MEVGNPPYEGHEDVMIMMRVSLREAGTEKPTVTEVEVRIRDSEGKANHHAQFGAY